MGERIVVIDDDAAVLETLTELLGDAGFDVTGCPDGRTGLEAIRATPPDLVVLDVNMPGIDGIEVCRRLRADSATAGIPVVMLTGLSSDADTLLGYDVGADDYVTKPWNARTLVARLRAVIRRMRPRGADSPLSHGPLRLDPGRREVRLDGKPLALTPAEFRILQLLMSRPERAHTRAELLESPEGDKDLTLRNVDTHVVAIRRKMGSHANLLATVFGVGYRIG
jgi:two-component system phosphate regulon response regulator PhoB